MGRIPRLVTCHQCHAPAPPPAVYGKRHGQHVRLCVACKEQKVGVRPTIGHYFSRAYREAQA